MAMVRRCSEDDDDETMIWIMRIEPLIIVSIIDITYPRHHHYHLSSSSSLSLNLALISIASSFLLLVCCAEE